MERKEYRLLQSGKGEKRHNLSGQTRLLLADADLSCCRILPADGEWRIEEEDAQAPIISLWDQLKSILHTETCRPMYAGPLWAEQGALFYGFFVEKDSLQSGDAADGYLPRLQQAWEEIARQRRTAYGALTRKIPHWYGKNARSFPWRQDKDPYRIWLSEIMLQQTRAAAVIPYYLRFLQALPTIADLAAAEEQTVLKLWEGLGYYSRARNLQKAAKMIVEQYDGVFPRSVEQIRALPGIGAYTAGAIAAICYDLPKPAVDGNVLRVLSRLTGEFRPIDLPEVRRDMEEQVRKSYPDRDRNGFEQGLIELGATVCPPNGQPQCALCPMEEYCIANRQRSWKVFPIRRPKGQRKVEQRTVLLLVHGARVAVRRRPEKGLLAGMWEFPNVPGHLTPQRALDIAQEMGVRPMRMDRMLYKTHVFTHVEWQMQGCVIHCGAEAPNLQWVDAEQMQRQVALPAAFKIFLSSVLENMDGKMP